MFKKFLMFTSFFAFMASAIASSDKNTDSDEQTSVKKVPSSHEVHSIEILPQILQHLNPQDILSFRRASRSSADVVEFMFEKAAQIGSPVYGDSKYPYTVSYFYNPDRLSPTSLSYFKNLGTLSKLPKELIEHILFSCPQEAIGINKAAFTIVTGYKPEDRIKKGLTNPPRYKIFPSFTPIKAINFKEIKPQTIPSYIWYTKSSEATSIPKEYWKYLKHTRVHTVSLNNIKAGEAVAFAEALKDSQVHAVNFEISNIEAKEAIDFAKALKGSQVHTVDFGISNIGVKEAIELAEALKDTQVSTVHICYDYIANAGVKDFAKALKGSQVQRIYLWGNDIKEATNNSNIYEKALRGAQERGTMLYVLPLLDSEVYDITYHRGDTIGVQEDVYALEQKSSFAQNIAGHTNSYPRSSVEYPQWFLGDYMNHIIEDDEDDEDYSNYLLD